jgi:type I restriction enzyme S subunit
MKVVEQFKRRILDLAIRGKLVPQDPNDEPASVLLERIKAEKAKLVKAGKIKKEKNPSEIVIGSDGAAYEKFGGDAPFELPQGWVWCKLVDIGSWKAGATPSRKEQRYYTGGNIPWLKTGDLNDGYVSDIPETITRLALEKNSVRLNPVGSVLMAMYGATIGKLGILQIESTTNQACCACIPYDGMWNRYLFYFLMARRQAFIKMGEGGAQPNISKEKIVNALIPLPPLAEQKRIVAKLEEILPLCERLK